MAHRYVVIVPRGAPETFAYLTRSLKDVRDVQVIVDRRATRAGTPPPAADRRARRERRDSREAFGCTLVRIAAPAEALA